MDLRGRLSNPEVREVVAQAAQAVNAIKVGAGHAVSLPPALRRWRLVDRIGADAIHKLAADADSGTTKRELAERYGISLSSVKRILK